ncbi:MAG: site-specific DNA-methyltransferase [Defluviitaleaceae bacterium]|nr:site-specific DNA-methyltransferase [Defluviitaleaceae bacterium]
MHFKNLIQRVLHLATNEDDLVLDSFLGFGTTAAVAKQAATYTLQQNI